MCVAFPGKILSIEGEHAQVDFAGALAEVNVSLIEAAVGDYVLVHAGMMLVVFTLAEMSSGIGYVLVLIVGNAFVMGLEALLVAIQVLRLEYYEMFSRFYDGDGIPFHPVTVEKH